MENNQVIARTGRVQSWMDDPKRHACLCHARYLLLKTQWRVPMELKPVGDLFRTLYDLEQVLQSISAKFGPQELITEKALLLQAQSHLAKSIAASTSNYAEEVSTKMEQLCSTSTSTTQTSIEFVNVPRHELPWAKRCVNVTD